MKESVRGRPRSRHVQQRTSEWLSSTRSTLLSFLGGSKCYESVGHHLAGERVVGTRLQPRVAKTMFAIYTGDRHVKAHGAMALSRNRNHGLAAGSAFAKNTLKAFMSAIKAECSEGKPRDYVDDLTLSVEGDTAAECAARMHTQLEQFKRALRRDNMALNDGNQQVLG